MVRTFAFDRRAFRDDSVGEGGPCGEVGSQLAAWFTEGGDLGARTQVREANLGPSHTLLKWKHRGGEGLCSETPIPTGVTTEGHARGLAWRGPAVFLPRPDDRDGRPV